MECNNGLPLICGVDGTVPMTLYIIDSETMAFKTLPLCPGFQLEVKPEGSKKADFDIKQQDTSKEDSHTQVPPSVTLHQRKLVVATGGRANASSQYAAEGICWNVEMDKGDGFELVNLDLTMEKEELKWDITAAQLPNMPAGKGWHGLMSIDATRLVCVGGFTNAGISKSCEFYNSSSRVWSLAPSLNCPRAQMGLCLMNQTELYAIAGRCVTGHFTNIIERLLLNSPTAEWRLLIFPTPQGPIYPSVLSLCAPVAPNCLLIAGGYLDQYETSYTFILNLKSMTATPASPLPQATSFLLPPTLGSETLFAVGRNLALYSYSLKGAKWSMISARKWTGRKLPKDP